MIHLFYNPSLLLMLNHYVKILFGCFFGLSTNSYLCFLYTESYLFMMTGKFLWPNFLLHAFAETQISISLSSYEDII